MYEEQVAPGQALSQGTSKRRPTAVIHYTIYLPDGGSISSHQTGSPYRYHADSDEIVPGIEEAVDSMEVGETRRIQLAPERAFGEFRADRVVEVDHDHVYSPMPLGTGQPVRLSFNDGLRQAFVREEREHSLVFDLNHPLAGLELTVDVTLLGYE